MNLDMETYCDLDLPTVGAHRYAEHPSLEVLCFAYTLDAKNITLVKQGDKIPKEFKDYLEGDGVIRAYNAQFERLILKHAFGYDLPPSRFIDTQALVCANSYPASLDRASEIILPSEHRKDKTGKELIRLFCKPRKPTRSDPRTRIRPKDDPVNFDLLCKYCIQDVVAEMKLVEALPRPHLQSREQLIWEHTVIQNDRGLPIDIEMVDQVVDVLEEWKVGIQQELIDYTKGEITTGGQIARMKAYVERHGYPMPKFDQAAMDKAEKDDSCPEPVKKIIFFRRHLGKTSTAKFKKLQEMLCDDITVKGNLFYYGTLTGRYGGRGFQMQNLPRANTKDPESLRRAFMERTVSGNLAVEASKLIRPSILAPEGFSLAVADYSSLENRGLHYLAGDTETLDKFRNGMDQYVDFAADRFGIDREEMIEGLKAEDPHYQKLRFRGKVAILGLGYKMWVDTYMATADSWGLPLDRDTATQDVQFYRAKYKLVTRLWFKLYKAAMLCVDQNIPTRYGEIAFRMIKNRLYMILPTGRPVVYNQPMVEEVPYFGKTKRAITFMGINPYSGKWQRLQITEGRLTENAVQALGREVQCIGALNCEEAGYKILGSVHDENIAIIPEGFGSIEEYCELNCNMPKELEGLPLQATGYIEKRYRKD